MDLARARHGGPRQYTPRMGDPRGCYEGGGGGPAPTRRWPHRAGTPSAVQCTSTAPAPGTPSAVRYLPVTCQARAMRRVPHGGGGPCAPRRELIHTFRIIQVCFCFLHVRLFNIYIRGAHTPPAQPTHRCQAGRSGTPPVTKARRRPRVHRNMFRNLQSGPSSCSSAPH
jgi:hypothetical protein